MTQRTQIFGDPTEWPLDDLIGLSEVFNVDLVSHAYNEGVFPMPLAQAMGWWSPLQRGVLRLDNLRVSRSLRQSAKRYRVSVDTAFEQVIRACADPQRTAGWIDAAIIDCYTELHRNGHVHSIETWDDTGRLVGGLYGVSIGGLFAGESMFHDSIHGRDASKVALLALVELLSDEYGSQRLVDAQWLTPHLSSLGFQEISREQYLEMLPRLLEIPAPAFPSHTRVIGSKNHKYSPNFSD